MIGILGRQQSATVEGIKGMAWDNKDLEIILEQWSKVDEIPEVPGSYYFSRAIDQAFWSVLEDKAKVKDAVTKWSKIADREIERKINEYK